MVPASQVTAILPTLGRVSLQEATKSLNAQTAKPIIIIKQGPEDTLIKLKEAVNEATTELVAVADDDAIYPADWLDNLSKTFGPRIGFVGGPCVPLLDEGSSSAEKAIAEVTSNWFGTSNMSYRMKVKGNIREADETNLIGNGMYRREVLAKILNEEFQDIPPAAWETYVFTRIKQLGYKTLYNPRGVFYHKMRSNIFSFSRQIFRCGMGRINFFKRFPLELLFKFYMLGPMVFLLYLVVFFLGAMVNLPITGTPLIGYTAIIVLISYGFKHSSRFQVFYYLVMHLSYGAGMLYGLMKNDRTWT